MTNRFLVAVSSRTGNTRIVAHAAADALGVSAVALDEAPAVLDAFDAVVLCFWCDKGAAPEDMRRFAARLSGKRIFCLATMGADPKSDASRAWIARTAKELTELGGGNTLAGTFLCRGCIDPAVFERMTQMLGGVVSPERQAHRDAAQTHPDRLDCLAVQRTVKEAFGL
ncbi:MAG: flavodoxin family protein [Duodenibacillus sp.]